MKHTAPWSMGSGGHAPQRRSARGPAAACRSLVRAFTLTELLIVISIIVIVLALAMPAFNIITGSKSQEMASNQLSVLLALARNNAIGQQRVNGVLFYLDPQNEQVTIALVQEVAEPQPLKPPNGDETGDANFDVYPRIDVLLELVPDMNVMTMPKGVGMQFVDDSSAGTASVFDDRYIGFNTVNAHTNGTVATAVKYGGVILFDSRGQLTSKSYALRTHDRQSSSPWNRYYSPLGALLYQRIPNDPTVSQPELMERDDVVPVNPLSFPALTLKSQIGFVLFDLETFNNVANVTLDDTQVSGVSSSYEAAEEQWLDQNASPYLVNRYNGTLIKGE